MSLTGKVALVTGASNGIGKATALRLAKDGASVAVCYFSDADGANDVVQQIGSERAVAIKADTSSVVEISSLIDQTVQRFDKIDILIPCAGIMVLKSLEETTEKLYDQMFGLNVKGPFFLCQVGFLQRAMNSY